MEPLYHLATVEGWAAAQAAGAYHGDTLAAEGFIHCSHARQVERVANAYYAGRTDLLLLTIDPARLSAEVRDEPSEGDRYPHVYGAIELDAVQTAQPLVPDADGRFVIAVRKPSR